MADRKFDMSDYVAVSERIDRFHAAYPDGSLQTVNWEIQELGGQVFVVYQAAAYRTPDDPRPGHGTAWEPYPGTTPYTKGSELMNAETGAWGRALTAIGFTAKRVDTDYIPNTVHIPFAAKDDTPVITAAKAAEINTLIGDKLVAGFDPQRLGGMFVAAGANPERINAQAVEQLTEHQAAQLEASLKAIPA